jgi:hypothetical protein
MNLFVPATNDAAVVRAGKTSPSNPMKSVVTFCIVALALSSLASASPPSENTAEKPQVIKLERFRKALWTVRVSVNGKTGDFLFDTGGGQTLVTDAFAAGLACRFVGRTTGYNMFGDRSDTPHCNEVQIRAGDVLLSRVSISKHDFGDQFPGAEAPDGLLSLDAFDGKAITLDQTARTLTIETTGSLAQRTRTMKELPLRVVRECSARCLSVFLGVPTKEGMTWLVLDSGAGGVSLISKEYAKAFALDPAAKEQQLKFEVAPGVPVDSPVIVTDMIMDGNLGQPFMSRYVITFDLARSRMWIAAP